VTIVGVEKAMRITYCGCVFVALGIQHVKAQAPYYHLWLVCFHHIFPRDLRKDTIFWGGGGDKYKMSILIFSTNFVRKISHSKKNSARYNYTEWCKSMYKILL